MSFDTHPGGPSALLQELETLALESKAAGLATAFGEFGLDYDRLYLTDKPQQLKYFEAQLDIAVRVQLPLFLHSRAAHEDFERLLKARLNELPRGGLVHSFTGTLEEMQRLVALGLSVGVNGCSLKSEENLEVVRSIPMERMMIETDGPWVRCFLSPIAIVFATFTSASRNLMSSSIEGTVTEQRLVRDESLPRLSKTHRRCAAFAESRQEREMAERLDGQGPKRASYDQPRCSRNRRSKRVVN